MTPLEQLRADQHMDHRTQNDEALQAFLAEIPAGLAALDRTPVTEIELRHLTRTRQAAA